ncbi:hypothetical protein HOY82DRAFT_787 [Tuber indicum]|nr:hypothetical protein HOY82DRAFT_787 [Tuber indicum]
MVDRDEISGRRVRGREGYCLRTARALTHYTLAFLAWLVGVVSCCTVWGLLDCQISKFPNFQIAGWMDGWMDWIGSVVVSCFVWLPWVRCMLCYCWHTTRHDN